MLRNSYINKYKEKSKYDPDDKFLKEDEEYLLKNTRPIPERTIRTLPPKKLSQFVEDVMTNKKVNYVLYSSNADNEIQKYIKSKEVLEKNSTKAIPRKKNEPSDIVKKRVRKEAFTQIKQAVDEFQKEKKAKKDELTKKNNQIYYQLKADMNSERNSYFDSLKRNRINDFTRSFNSIKNKLNALKGREIKPTCETEETYTSIVNKPFYTESSKVILPEMKLDINDVYSRLYKNVVLLSEPKKNDKKKKGQNGQKKEEEAKTGINTNHKNAFKLKNILKSTNGKEFTIKLNDEMIQRCFLKYSGGPGAIPILKNLMEEGKKTNVVTREDQVNFYNLSNKDGNTFLHLVIIEDLPELAEYLIDKGTNVNSQNNEGDTPLHIAIRNKYKDCIDLLMKNGARIDIPNNNNEIVYEMSNSEIKKKYGMDKEIVIRRTKKKN